MKEQTIIILKSDAFTRFERGINSSEKAPHLQDELYFEPELGEPFVNYVKTLCALDHLQIQAEKRMTMSREQACLHYEEHVQKETFDALIDYICSGEVHVMHLEGENAVLKGRAILRMIRARYLKNVKARDNFIHASDSVEEAERERILHFEKF